MANNISKYLRNAGVKTPEEMTEAQIGEQNKANPLSSYGFMSAQQKQQRQQQMAMYEQEMQRQQQMQQQQLIAQMSSQEKIGHYAGSGLMGLMGYLKNKGASPEVAPAAPTDDPELERFNQLASEVGSATALEMLGQEQGNAAMVQQGQDMRTAQDKASLEAKYKQSQISEADAKLTDPNRGYQYKPGYSDEEDVMMDGKPGVRKRTLIKNTPEGGVWKYGKPALKGSTTGTKDEWETSKGGINERTKNMENALTSTANALDAYDRLDKLITDTPASGWSGALVSKADDIVGGVRNLGTLLAKTEGREVTASMDSADYDFAKMEKFAGGANKIKSMVLQLAYAQAAATGDSSRSLSDRDVQNQIDIIGGQITNPRNFKSLMDQNKQVLVQKLENMGKYTKIDGKSIGEAYGSDIAELKNRVTMGGGIGGGVNEDAQMKRYLELKNKYKR